MKSVEQLEESITSLRQWLSDADEYLITPVVYQRANAEEIQRHLGEQEASASVNIYYIRQVNGVKLVDILFYLRFRPSVCLCTLIFRCKYLENGLR